MDRNSLQIFHVNLNCSDLDRSVMFYELIGFSVVNDFGSDQQGFAEIGLPPILRMPEDCDARAVLMALSDDPRATRLDLIEWKRPESERVAKGDLARIGFGRLCLKVRDCQELHDKLAAAGHAPYSAPLEIVMGGTRQLVFCVDDPDGTVVEFMQFLKPGRDK
ncbi:MAG: VOC family protein [Rhodospirillaceae bacterium]|jgi:predicted lactoylglutathione lyase|nr:VOC family protein [Rhodospirillaceae bacterium]MBT4687102.1 VOC family protein [Rhodospirillaceae bacterium]MBT5081292.1 VOC family protein [Rhodospirillaceae bacterium]MBT5522776.1 VOC family protein [Rhodospirillaceae bacterium]MBT5880989.1 VOC family protein [Rhodospirillaceae bacterium]